MASSSVEDVDLIDLDSGSGMSRVPTLPVTQEEQEHLLDVCPPKLEQKLSLSKRQQELLTRDELDGDEHHHVLVTLGHDQVVPIRKRIDVVSSDTIKRVRDITKNLEPVIRRSAVDIDQARKETKSAGDEDDIISYAAVREINDAFDFLKELDDNDDSHVRQDCQVTRHPLEPLCFVENSSDGIDKNQEHDNLAFEPSPPSKYESQEDDRWKSLNVGKLKESFKRHRQYASFGLEKPKQSKQHRKSWNEEGAGEEEYYCCCCCCKGDQNELDKTCSGNNADCCHEPSTSSENKTVHEGHVVHATCLAASKRSLCSECSSECSSVDWSWVEEVECRCGGGAPEKKKGVAATPTSGEASAAAAPAPPVWYEANGSVAMSVAATTGKSMVAGSPGPPERDAANSNSWLRASMRRLRHLRLPDATAASTAAPSSLPDIALIAPEILAAQTNGTSGSLLRPSSAPAPVASSASPPRRTGRRIFAGTQRGGVCGRTQQQDRPSRHALTSVNASDSTICSSSSASSGSSTTTSPASSPAASPQRAANVNDSRRLCERQRDSDRGDERGEDDDEDENPLGKWPHALSPALACLGCTLGLFNISRFAILSIQFGANFIVQFLILSFVLGIPVLTLQVCLGQRLAAGTVDMWKISPLFQGVGIALLTAQAFIGIYSIIGVSWMFVYFRDSFITKQDKYRWAEPFLLYREDTRPSNNGTSYKLHETVPDYFSGAVLQRHHLTEPDPGVVTLKFQVAFNLAVVWMIVFVSLSKGLRSYGKVVYVFTLVPIFGTLVLCTKLLGLTPPGSINQLFPATAWSEFFINGKSWVAASTEVFLTWGLLGAAAMQIAAHNKHKHLLQRDTSLVIVLTFVVLLLAAFLANTCVQILRHHGYAYTISSFERISGYTFMRLLSQPTPPSYSSVPERFMPHASFLVGQRVVRPGSDLNAESGYQVLRLSTELVPATLALLGTEQVSPFWAVLFYFILILFGIAQQLAIWHCVITGIMAINTKMMKLWETTITFFSCACAYVLGLPMATELGIYVVYYLDYTVGGAWWIIILYLVQVGAVFAVRGRPHSGEAVVAELFPPTGRCLRHWAGPLLSFTWNVILPISLMVLSITIFKSSGFRELYSYRRTSRDYWAVWARQLGAAIQLIPILLIPVVAIVQTCRYLNNGPPDIFDRIQLLYRPSLEPDDHQSPATQIGSDGSTAIHGNGILSSATELPFEDPPPKYTPPPSYTTATGARIAKMLRQSFRRSVRRIASVLGESSAPRSRPALQPPPPDYATVLVEMNHHGMSSTELSGDSSNSPDRMTTRINTIDGSHLSAEQSHQRPFTSGGGSSNLTAAEVANLLRSSIRRGTSRTQQNLRRSFAGDESRMAISVENLVEAVAPISQDYSLPKEASLVPSATVIHDDEHHLHDDDDDEDDDDDDKKTAEEMERNSVSVI